MKELRQVKSSFTAKVLFKSPAVMEQFNAGELLVRYSNDGTDSEFFRYNDKPQDRHHFIAPTTEFSSNTELAQAKSH